MKDLQKFLNNLTSKIGVRWKVLFTVVLLVNGVLGYFRYTVPHREKVAEIYEKTKTYKSFQMSGNYSSVVVDKWMYKGSAMLTMADGQRFFFPQTINHKNDPFDLDAFVEVGDVLTKDNESDTIWINRESKNHYFRIGSILK